MGFKEKIDSPLPIRKVIFQKMSLMYQLSDEAERKEAWFTFETVVPLLQSRSDEWALGGTPQKPADHLLVKSIRMNLGFWEHSSKTERDDLEKELSPC